ncbi:hypothetical protein ACIRU8_39440 [Streptomyces sp. NPDC101175]|uniref:hypothetical protein n=1 Tax=Streptomyces sp. NPDC101175 TaxID=3366123 RepID=UPI0038389959
MTRTARITQLRHSIARRALTAAGIPADARILDVYRVRDAFIVATENPADRWASYYVETFRIPTPDDTNRDYEPGQAPKIWIPLAGWSSNSSTDIPGLMGEAIGYVNRELA